MTYAFPVASAAMWVATLLLPTTTDRLRGALGFPAFLLGIASVPYLPGFRGPSLTVWISAALLLLGPGMLLLAVWGARRLLHPLVAAVSLLAGTAAVVAAWPTLRQGGVLPAVLTAGAIGLGAWLAWLVGSMVGLGRLVRRLGARLPAPRGRHPWAVLVLAAGAMGVRLAAVVWPLWVLSWQPVGVGVGVLCLAWAAATGRPRLALAAAALAAAFSSIDQLDAGWLLLTVAALADRNRAWVMVALAPFGLYLALPVLLGAEVVFTVLLMWLGTILLAVLAAGAEDGASPSR